MFVDELRSNFFNSVLLLENLKLGLKSYKLIELWNIQTFIKWGIHERLSHERVALSQREKCAEPKESKRKNDKNPRQAERENGDKWIPQFIKVKNLLSVYQG